MAAARAFLKNQGAAQVQRARPRPREEVYAPTGAAPGMWLGDVIYLADYAGVNKRRSAIFTLLNVNTRFARARALTRATAAKTAEAMTEILDEKVPPNVGPILRVRTDGGPEFAGEFSKLLAERGIKHEKTEAGTHERLARLDRFHRTLRQMIGELFEVRGSHVWFDVLPLLIRNYNERPNLGLSAAGKGLAPVDVGPREEKIIREDDLAWAEEVRRETDESGVGPGTQVRLLYSRTKAGAKDKFAKSHEAVWTRSVYNVVDRTGPNSFVIDVPPGEVATWPLHALQVVRSVAPSAAEGPRVDKAVVRAQRMEARNVSPEEAAEALAGPSRPRSERAPRVDYRALAGLKA